MMRKSLFQENKSKFQFRFFSGCCRNRKKDILAAHKAVIKGDASDLLRMLKFIDPNDRLQPGDFTLLHRAVISTNPGKLETMLPIIELLLDQGADPNEIYHRGKSIFSPLHSATRRALPEVVKVLLNAGANSTFENEKGKTALYYAELNNSDRREPIVSLLKQEPKSSGISVLSS